MDIYGKFQPITEQSLYDFYGCASLNLSLLNTDERKIVDFELKRLKGMYISALFKRFAYWNPTGSKALTIEAMIKQLKDLLYEETSKQSSKMTALGTGFNIMTAVKQMRGESEEAKKKVEAANTKQFADSLSNFKSADYPKIAKGVVKLYEASSARDIIEAIDYMNDLQHCGGYILIDLNAGQRDPSNKEGQRVLQNILDIKKNAKSPREFLDKMSEEIRDIVSQYNRL